MSKVLRLLDFEDHLTHDHYYWLLENETDNDFTADDIPF